MAGEERKTKCYRAQVKESAKGVEGKEFTGANLKMKLSIKI